jgi:hypothetical protein
MRVEKYIARKRKKKKKRKKKPKQTSVPPNLSMLTLE